MTRQLNKACLGGQGVIKPVTREHLEKMVISVTLYSFQQIKI